MAQVIPPTVQTDVQEAEIIEQKTPPKLPKLTRKQEKFKNEYIRNGFDGTKAAVVAYPNMTRKSAAAMATENLQKPAIIESLKATLESQGVDDEWISKKIVESINAGLGIKAKNSDALRGLDMLMKVTDKYPGKKSLNVNVNADARYQELIHMTPQELTEKLRQIHAQTAQLLADMEANKKPIENITPA